MEFGELWVSQRIRVGSIFVSITRIYIFTDHLPETEHVQSQKRVKRKRELIKKRIFSRKRRWEFNSEMEIQGFADQVQHVALDIGGKKTQLIIKPLFFPNCTCELGHWLKTEFFISGNGDCSWVFVIWWYHRSFFLLWGLYHTYITSSESFITCMICFNCA